MFCSGSGACGLGVQLPGACGDGVREAGAMTPHARMPRAVTPGCHGCSTALLELWWGAQGAPRLPAAGRGAPSAPGSPPRWWRPCRVPGTLPPPSHVAPAPRPALRPAPAPGFQTHSALDRHALQPIRSRKASAQRSLSAVDQSASPDPYIPPSEDKLCRLLPGLGGHVECGRGAALAGRAFPRPLASAFPPSAPGAADGRRRLARGAVEGCGAAPGGWQNRVVAP